MTSPTANDQGTSVMARLKAETADQHHRAERHPFMGALMRGQLSHAEYAQRLEQMLLVHRALERSLRNAQSRHAWASVIHAEQFIEGHLLADIAHFAGSPAPSLRPATARLIKEIHRAENHTPIRLLGMHYVTEGSKNGAVFIARALRHAYRLAPGQGDRSLDPYGSDQRAKWLAFKDAVDALPLSPLDHDEMVHAARTMFDGITAIAEEAWSQIAPVVHRRAADAAAIHVIPRTPAHQPS